MSFIQKIKSTFSRASKQVALNDSEYRVKQILHQQKHMEDWKDEQLRFAHLAFKEDLAKGKVLEDLLVPAFALTCEAARRVLNKQPDEEQIFAGLAMHLGKVATVGFGKDQLIMLALPAYLNALSGKGVHVATSDDRRSEAQATATSELFKVLGMRCAFVLPTMIDGGRRSAYAADITFVSAKQLALDFLHDNLCFSRLDLVLRDEHPLYVCLVEDLDSILINQAFTKQAIVEPAMQQRKGFEPYSVLVKNFFEGEDFVAEHKHKTLALTAKGLTKAVTFLPKPGFSREDLSNIYFLDASLKAQVLYDKGRDYEVPNDEVLAIDEFSGKPLLGLRFPYGLQQALEAKEALPQKYGIQKRASLSFFGFFTMYEKFAGVSSTALRVRRELNEVYKLGCAPYSGDQTFGTEDFSQRLSLYELELVAAEQCESVYDLRRQLLESPKVFLNFLKYAVKEQVENIFELNDVQLIKSQLFKIFYIDVEDAELAELFLVKKDKKAIAVAQQYLISYLTNRVLQLQDRQQAFSSAQSFALNLIDQSWSQNLSLLDSLKEEFASEFSKAPPDVSGFEVEAEKLFEQMQVEVAKQFVTTVFLYLNQHGI